jgi:uncharacterized RDD family membrane protein YckC
MSSGPRFSHRLPRPSRDATDLVVLAAIMLLLALFAPLVGALFALFIIWHSHHNGFPLRRNVAYVCAGLAILDLLVPTALLPHLP